MIENPIENRGALRGIKVIELGQLIAGPFCGQLLGDMGADVIKVEAPGAGDPMRAWGRGEHKLWWEVVSRNKRSVSANLRVPAGQDLVRKLAADADILIENFKPGTLEKWNLGPDVLHALNPRLIIVRVSGYGQTGPYASRAGFGGIGEAMGGIRHLTGHPAGTTDLPPPRSGVSISDDLAGMYAAIGLLASLWQRDVGVDGAGTGRGRVVDVNLVDSVFSLMEGMLPEYALDGRIRQPAGAAIATAAPTNTYKCADGKFLCVAGNSDAIFMRLMEAIGRPDLGGDPAYASNARRCAHREALDVAIAAWTRTLPAGRRRSFWRRPTCRARASTTSPIVPPTRISGRADRCSRSRTR